MSVTIRSVRRADAAVLADLLTQLGYPSSAAEVGDRLRYWLDQPRSRVFVAESAGRVVGALTLHALPYLLKTGSWGRIESLVVDEPVRGTGAGRALIDAAEEQARSWGCLLMEVTSSRHRTGAHAFYRRLGYVDQSERSGRFAKSLD